MIYPLSPSVWMVVLGSLLFVQFSIWVFAKVEETAMETKLLYWTSYWKVSWYAYATLIGESINRERDFRGAWAIKYVLRSSIIVIFGVTAVVIATGILLSCHYLSISSVALKLG